MPFLRPEAQPAAFNDLLSDQQQAFNKVALLLRASIERLPSASDASTMSSSPRWLQPDRSGQIAFISGERGTGKSTVLLSLVAETVGEKPTHLSEFPDDSLKSAIEQIRDRVVFLEPLDLETAPASCNLLASILARISAEIEQDEVRAPRGLIEAVDFDTQFLTLDQLRRHVSLAWDGNLAQRAGHLDPEAYSAEVLESEDARLNLNRKLSQTLHNLSQTHRRFQKGGPPLFVVPIDDVDLNPERSLELLRLVRMLYCPQLFFIVVGDSRLVHLVLSLQFTGKLSRISDRNSNFDPASGTEAPGIVADLASNAQRKMIPPAQTAELPRLLPQQAIAYRPPRKGTEQPSLQDLFNRLPIQIHDSVWPVLANANAPSVQSTLPTSLGGLLAWPKSSGLAFDDQCLWLNLPLRHLLDLYQEIDATVSSDSWQTKSASDSPSATAIDIVKRMCRQTIKDDPLLTLHSDIQSQLITNLNQSESGDPTKLFLGFKHNPNNMSDRVHTIRIRNWTSPLNTPTQAANPEPQFDIRIGNIRGLEIRPEKGESPALPRPATSALSLLHDLRFLSRDSTPEIERDLLPPKLTYQFTPVWVELAGKGDVARVCSWPAPWIQTFVDFYFWQVTYHGRLLWRTDPSNFDLSLFVVQWIHLNLCVAFRESRTEVATAEEGLGQIEEMLGIAFQRPRPVPPRISYNINRIIVMLMPEFLCPKAVVEAITSIEGLEGHLRDNQAGIHDLRLRMHIKDDKRNDAVRSFQEQCLSDFSLDGELPEDWKDTLCDLAATELPAGKTHEQ